MSFVKQILASTIKDLAKRLITAAFRTCVTLPSVFKIWVTEYGFFGSIFAPCNYLEKLSGGSCDELYMGIGQKTRMPLCDLICRREKASEAGWERLAQLATKVNLGEVSLERSEVSHAHGDKHGMTYMLIIKKSFTTGKLTGQVWSRFMSGFLSDGTDVTMFFGVPGNLLAQQGHGFRWPINWTFEITVVTFHDHRSYESALYISTAKANGIGQGCFLAYAARTTVAAACAISFLAALSEDDRLGASKNEVADGYRPETSGYEHVQVVSNNGEIVLDEQLNRSSIYGQNGFEWVAFKTNKSPMKSPAAGHNSVFRAMPLEVNKRVHDLTELVSKLQE
nr:hypothetical protein [Tanacetum cinerariifolium]